MKCHNKSEIYERMMDLTVEIDGDVRTLEQALRRFTASEMLEGDNKYYCNRFAYFFFVMQLSSLMTFFFIFTAAQHCYFYFICLYAFVSMLTVYFFANSCLCVTFFV